MNLILNKPYKPIWLAIPLIIGLSVIGINNAIEIQLHDAYFVIATIHVGILFSIILGVVGILYWLIRNKKLVNWMTTIHVTTTILTFVLIVITGLPFKKVVESNFDTFRTVNQILFVIIPIMIVSQLIFLGNLIISSIRNEEKN